MTCGGDRASAAASGPVGAARERAYLERHPPLSRDGEAELLNSCEPGACPWCGSGAFKRDGRDRNGVQRYRCRSCGRSFTPATGTIFDTRRPPVSEWAMFLPKPLGSEGEAACARDHLRSSSTPPCWVAKLFLVLAGCQGAARLPGRVWIDETCRPVDRAERVRREDGTELRGLSRNKMCMGVGTDAHGSTPYLHEGRGKTSRARTEAAFGGHIARRSTLVHDREGSHNVLVGRLSLRSEAHDARECARLPDRENPLDMVNQECNPLKKFLRAHTGFRAADLQGWLDVCWVSRNVGSDMEERVAWVLDRAMRFRGSLRYREFYSGRRSSGAQ